MSHLKMIGLLAGEQDLILGKSKPFFAQEVELSNVLEIVGHIVEGQAKKNKVKLTFDPGEMRVSADMNVLKNGFEQLILCLMQTSKNIQVKANEKKNVVDIEYEGGSTLKMEKKDLLAFLNEKHSYAEIFCKMAVEMMKMCGIQTTFKKNVVTLTFTKS